jgi:hypothetical protein
MKLELTRFQKVQAGEKVGVANFVNWSYTVLNLLRHSNFLVNLYLDITKAIHENS